MKITSTKFSGLKIIQSKIHKDKRGHFKEDFKKKYFNKINFVFSCTSKSKKNVIRGLHLQTKFSQGKYVSILKGSVFDVVVDLRKKSKTFGKHFKILLSDKNAKSLFIPAGFAHGFLGLGNENIIYYHCTNYRSKKHEIGLRRNDDELKIKWPTKNPKISNQDKKNLMFNEFKKIYIKK